MPIPPLFEARCPVCIEVATSYEEHAPGATCIACKPEEPGRSHRRYHPCLHVVEVVDGVVSIGCCPACSGRGSTVSGPCWDCLGTGHAHPDPEDCP